MPEQTGTGMVNTDASTSLFIHRRLVIATMHHKEFVIAPLVKKHLGASPFVPEFFDTDSLGTFCGKVERVGEPVDVLRQKCLLAMEKTGCDLGIASEGSFGPHPFLPGLPADDELVIFIDKKHELEIIARELSTQTNYQGAEVNTIKQLKDFTKQAGFPEHGLILRDRRDNTRRIYKGLTSWTALLKAHRQLILTYGTAFAETDMRAKYNPTRMQVIRAATEKLMAKINACCPACGMPGFDISDIIAGLPCRLCHLPTRSALRHVYTCTKCRHTLEKNYPHHKTDEDPMYCDFCNP